MPYTQYLKVTRIDLAMAIAIIDEIDRKFGDRDHQYYVGDMQSFLSIRGDSYISPKERDEIVGFLKDLRYFADNRSVKILIKSFQDARVSELAEIVRSSDGISNSGVLHKED